MSVQTVHYVACNECGDPSPVNVEGAAAARREAREVGFLFYNGSDKCPRCRRDPQAGEVRARLGIPEREDNRRRAHNRSGSVGGVRILQANALTVRRFDSTQHGKAATVQSFSSGETVFNYMRGFYMEEIKHTDDGIYIKRVEQAERRATIGMGSVQ